MGEEAGSQTGTVIRRQRRQLTVTRASAASSRMTDRQWRTAMHATTTWWSWARRRIRGKEWIFFFQRPDDLISFLISFLCFFLLHQTLAQKAHKRWGGDVLGNIGTDDEDCYYFWKLLFILLLCKKTDRLLVTGIDSVFFFSLMFITCRLLVWCVYCVCVWWWGWRTLLLLTLMTRTTCYSNMQTSIPSLSRNTRIEIER